MRSSQKCLTSKNKASSTKIVFQLFVDDALFYEELPSVSAVYLVLDDARGRMAQTCRFNYRLRQVCASSESSPTNHSL